MSIDTINKINRYRILINVEKNRITEVAELVTERLGTIDGIEKTNTMLTFRAFSKHSLESKFFI